MTILYGHVEVLSPELWQAFKLSPEPKAWSCRETFNLESLQVSRKDFTQGELLFFEITQAWGPSFINSKSQKSGAGDNVVDVSTLSGPELFSEIHPAFM